MSWLHCDNCHSLIDTDSDPGAYDGGLELWFCYDCRGKPGDDEEDE